MLLRLYGYACVDWGWFVMSNPGAEALQALINYSNEITGESNTTLSDAVESLVAGYGGGSSGGSWEKKFSTEVNISTTNTGVVKVADLVTNCPELYTTGDIILIRIRDKAGKRSGYYYGCDEYYYPSHNGGRAYATIQMRYANNDEIKLGTTTHGLWIAEITQSGALKLYTRYSATASLIIDGTYAIDVYVLKGPNGDTPYAD